MRWCALSGQGGNMLAKALSMGLIGIEAYLIEVEADVSSGLPAVTLVGMADAAVKESRERVKSAIKNSGYEWPAQRITVNLAPSDIKKEGASFDLAIALAILAATEQIDAQRLNMFAVLGELSLDGLIRPVTGALAASLFLSQAEIPVKDIILPLENAAEAAWANNVNIWPAHNLKEAVEIIHQTQSYSPYQIERRELANKICSYGIDFSDVKGQYLAKRALEVAVAGGHNILMIGPPGSGKTMLAERLPTIMPELTEGEIIEINRIHSVAGTIPKKDGILFRRPFRAPHHNCSSVALVGGGAYPRPGEISLSHRGVLFLDELPEFRRDCLEALRQPLEEGCIRISRARRSITYPASFMLVCAMNPCPCGFYTDRKRLCRCGTTKIQNYKAKISGPLVDRIDIHVEVPVVKYQELSSNLAAESSEQIKIRIDKARLMQKERLSSGEILFNAQMSHKQVRKFCCLAKVEAELLKTAMNKLNFSARAYDKILKVSRTIADLAECEEIKAEHLAEAVQYRSLDRSFI